MVFKQAWDRILPRSQSYCYCRWFRELKEMEGRFYNNINSKVVKSTEYTVAAVAQVRNMLLRN